MRLTPGQKVGSSNMLAHFVVLVSPHGFIDTTSGTSDSSWRAAGPWAVAAISIDIAGSHFRPQGFVFAAACDVWRVGSLNGEVSGRRNCT